jgi:hypothetical protein
MAMTGIGVTARNVLMLFRGNASAPDFLVSSVAKEQNSRSHQRHESLGAKLNQKLLQRNAMSPEDEEP